MRVLELNSWRVGCLGFRSLEGGEDFGRIVMHIEVFCRLRREFRESDIIAPIKMKYKIEEHDRACFMVRGTPD